MHNCSSKKPVQKAYLKSRLNCVLLAPGFDPMTTQEERTKEEADKEEAKEADGDDEDNDEVDALWDNMDVVGDKKRKAAVLTNKPVAVASAKKKRKKKA